MFILENPTKEDVKIYLGFAMNKPSNLSFEQACNLISQEMNLTSGEVKAMVYGDQNLPEIQEAFRIQN